MTNLFPDFESKKAFAGEGLWDAKAAHKTTEAAIQQVDENADQQWKEEALEVVQKLAWCLEEFTPDHIWNVIRKPREPSALGPVMRRAVREGWIEPTERFVKSKIPTRHCHNIRVWHSRIYLKEEFTKPLPSGYPYDPIKHFGKFHLNKKTGGV